MLTKKQLVESVADIHSALSKLVKDIESHPSFASIAHKLSEADECYAWLLSAMDDVEEANVQKLIELLDLK